MIRVVHKEPGKRPAIVDVNGESLDDLQALVGGYIDLLHVRRGLVIVFNEEGRLLGLEPNVALSFPVAPNVALSEAVRGPVFMAAVRDEDFVDMTDEQIAYAIAALGGDTALGSA